MSPAKGQAPPAVPSFGAPFLPMKKPDPIVSVTTKPKPRKSNLLGLTPKLEDESSSEDEDMAQDEETKLASQAGGASLTMYFTLLARLAPFG